MYARTLCSCCVYFPFLKAQTDKISALDTEHITATHFSGTCTMVEHTENDEVARQTAGGFDALPLLAIFCQLVLDAGCTCYFSTVSKSGV